MIKNHFIFYPGQELKFYWLSAATFYDWSNTIYQFSKSFLDNKISFFFLFFFFFFLRTMEPLRGSKLYRYVFVMISHAASFLFHNKVITRCFIRNRQFVLIPVSILIMPKSSVTNILENDQIWHRGVNLVINWNPWTSFLFSFFTATEHLFEDNKSMTKTSILRCATNEKGPYAICGQRRTWSACAFAQADQGLRCPLTESMDIVVYVDEQRMSRSDSTDAHAHLDLRCSHMA